MRRHSRRLVRNAGCTERAVRDTAGHRNGRSVPAIVLALTAVGAVLRFFGLNGMGLWLDESNSVIIAAEDLSGMVQRLRLDSSPILYYLLLHFWTLLFGVSALAVKSLSAVFGVLLIPATFLLGREMSGRKVGLWASGLMAIAPLAIYYSREARMYSLLPLLGALLFWSALRFLRGGGRRVRPVYVATAVCCLYTHNLGVFLWIIAALLWWTIRRPSVSVGRWILWQVPILVLYLPWVPVLLEQIQNPGHYGWLESFWTAYPPWAAMYRSLETFVHGGPLPIYMDLVGLGWTRVWVPLLALGFLILGITRRPGRKTDDDDGAARHGRLSVLVFLGPLLLPFLYSLAFQPVYAVGRTDVIAYPAFLILITAGALQLKKRGLAAGGLVLFTALSLAVLGPYYGSNRRTGDREISEHAAALTRPYDLILCTGFARASTEYYFKAWGKPRIFLSYPADVAGHLGNLDETALLKDPDRLGREAEQLTDRIEGELCKGRRCLILRSPMPINRILWTALEKRFAMSLADPPGGFRQAVLQTPINVGRLSLPESVERQPLP